LCYSEILDRAKIPGAVDGGSGAARSLKTSLSSKEAGMKI